MSLLSIIYDFLSPRTCSVCGNRLAPTEEDICAVCNWQLPRTHFCRAPYDNELAKNFWGRLPLERCAAFFYYIPGSKVSSLVYKIKYHGDAGLAYSLGRKVAEEFSVEGFFEGIDLIVPVPITRMRRWHRGYNQSQLIAKGISDVTGIPLDATVIKRVRFSVSQTSLTREERAQNVAGSYRLLAPGRVESRHVLVVDDIITTGSTVCSCATEICKAGNVRISILSLGFTKA